MRLLVNSLKTSTSSGPRLGWTMLTASIEGAMPFQSDSSTIDPNNNAIVGDKSKKPSRLSKAWQYLKNDILRINSKAVPLNLTESYGSFLSAVKYLFPNVQIDNVENLGGVEKEILDYDRGKQSLNMRRFLENAQKQFKLYDQINSNLVTETFESCTACCANYTSKSSIPLLNLSGIGSFAELIQKSFEKTSTKMRCATCGDKTIHKSLLGVEGELPEHLLIGIDETVPLRKLDLQPETLIRINRTNIDRKLCDLGPCDGASCDYELVGSFIRGNGLKESTNSFAGVTYKNSSPELSSELQNQANWDARNVVLLIFKKKTIGGGESSNVGEHKPECIVSIPTSSTQFGGSTGTANEGQNPQNGVCKETDV